MTKYRVQTATALTDWATRGEYDSLDRAQLSARAKDRHGLCVRIVTDEGVFVEGRTDEYLANSRRAFAAARGK